MDVTTPRSRRLRVAALLAAAASIVLVGSAAAPAVAAVPAASRTTANQATPAAVKIGDFKVPYTRTWQVRSSKLHRCVSFTATGTFTYTVSRLSASPPLIEWTKQKINAPSLAATAQRTNGKGKCVGSVSLTKLAMAQHWTGFACSFNPSISFNLPWGVGVSAWPTCNHRNQATRSHIYGSGSKHTMFDSGARVGYGNVNASSATSFPCYGVYLSTTLFSGGNSDSFSTNVRKVCLTKF